MMTQEATVRLNGSSSVMYLYVYIHEDVSYEQISPKQFESFWS